MASTKLIGCPFANAIGKWIAQPVTPDKTLKALGKSQNRKCRKWKRGSMLPRFSRSLAAKAD
jgi:hypothetical protein